VIPPDIREELIARQAREWPSAERAAFLDGVCGGDAALRQRVETRLAEPAEAEQLGTTVADPHGALAQRFAEEGPGAVIGRYRLLEKIGEGGFGAVYAAEQKEPVKRRVALKIIKQTLPMSITFLPLTIKVLGFSCHFKPRLASLSPL